MSYLNQPKQYISSSEAVKPKRLVTLYCMFKNDFTVIEKSIYSHIKSFIKFGRIVHYCHFEKLSNGGFYFSPDNAGETEIQLPNEITIDGVSYDALGSQNESTGLNLRPWPKLLDHHKAHIILGYFLFNWNSINMKKIILTWFFFINSLSLSANELGTTAIMETASRINGFAPLGVHFSTVDVASGVLQPQGGDYDNLTYQWDFGDNSSGTWEVDGKSRNYATGFVASHVYTDSGVYTVNLTVEDDQGQTTLYSQQITVLDTETASGWITYYVAANGSDSNNGTSTSTPFATFNHAMDQIASNTRILFRRGDTWSANTGWINHDGPGIIGAYGTGNRPVIQFSGGKGIQFGWNTDNRDWRIMGLRFEGNGSGYGIFAEGTQLNQLLVWDMEIISWGVGILLSADCDFLDQTIIAASRVEDIRTSWTIYMGGSQSSVQGNYLDKQTTSASHTFRNYCANGFSATHNYFGPAHHHSMKLHAPDWVDGELTSENIVITDNTFEGSNWTVGIAPENNWSDERISNVLYERNAHLRTANTSIGIVIRANKVTIRNNIFINNQSGDYDALVLERYAVPEVADNHIYHNTFFAEQNSSGLTPVIIRSGVSDTKVFNNLLAPASGGFTIDNSGTGLLQGNNLATNTPGFINPGNRILGIEDNSPARNFGADLGVLYDYDKNNRDTSPDVGAFEYINFVDLIFADNFE